MDQDKPVKDYPALQNALNNEGLDLPIQESSLTRLRDFLSSQGVEVEGLTSKQLLVNLHQQTLEVVSRSAELGLDIMDNGESMPRTSSIKIKGDSTIYDELLGEDDVTAGNTINVFFSPDYQSGPRAHLSNGVTIDIYHHTYTLKPDGKMISNSSYHGQPQIEVDRAPSIASTMIDTLREFNQAVISGKFTNFSKSNQ